MFELVVDDGSGYIAKRPFETKEAAERAGLKWLEEFCVYNDLSEYERLTSGAYFDVREV